VLRPALNIFAAHSTRAFATAGPTYIDLYQFHHIDRDTPWDEISQAMDGRGAGQDPLTPVAVTCGMRHVGGPG
jgi:hypothetical protein